jgi:hypothetical protein
MLRAAFGGMGTMADLPAFSAVDQAGRGGREPGQTRSEPVVSKLNRPPIDAPHQEGLDSRGARLERTLLAFVVLGVLLRVGHYLANYPLWGDEAFLAISFLRRGYGELLLPLEYGQLCPILFLSAELTAVKLFGFSEMSLRLCPLICGVASVFLFRRVAGRILNGQALLFAVAIFAVSIHPIRHSADAKPYASDLLLSLGLLALAVEWYRSKQQTGWLWLLAGFAPIALGGSYPAVLVAGGVGLGLAPSVWQTRRQGPMIALAAYALTVAATFAVLFGAHGRRQQGTGTLLALQNYWADSFPPLDSPARLLGWLIRTHAGSMFAYPGGGNHGASACTLVLVLVGALVFWRRRQRVMLAMLTMPIGLALVAAGLRLYPYGGQARIMQYLAPAICLMAGSGVGTLVGFLPRATTRLRVVRLAAIALAVMGVVLLAEDARHPYRAIYDYQAREFARRFWPEQARGAEVVSLEWDFGVRRPKADGVRTALYLCNQHIYCPNRRPGHQSSSANVMPGRPLRCVVFDEEVLERPEAIAWLDSMEKRFVLRGRSKIVARSTGLDQKPWADHLTVLEFLPRSERPTPAVAFGGGNERSAR